MLDRDIGKAFTDWVGLYDSENEEGGQFIVEHFVGFGQTGEKKVPLYTRAPADWNPHHN